MLLNPKALANEGTLLYLTPAQTTSLPLGSILGGASIPSAWSAVQPFAILLYIVPSSTPVALLAALKEGNTPFEDSTTRALGAVLFLLAPITYLF